MDASDTTPDADPVVEAGRVTASAEAAGLTARVTGGVGIAMRCPSSTRPELARRYADIDLVADSRQRRDIIDCMLPLGYQPDEAFNAVHGARRLYFWDAANGRQLDIFFDRLEMCHRVELRERLAIHPQTLSLADLLLLKLQIVETNHKDLADIVALLFDHDLTEDETGINLAYLSGIAADDWGLWRTTTRTLEKADHLARELAAPDITARTHAQTSTFLQRLEHVPKSSRWKLRARIGERKRWYELPEEEH
jgi:hypothetical protein